MRKILLLVLLVCSLINRLHAQSDAYFRDSADGKFDVSEWVLTAHGFIPIPILITEPALGNFGMGFIPVFITRNDPYIDTIEGKVITSRVKPNIYGLAAAYTLNGTWLTGAFTTGAIRKWRSNYRLAAAYADINMTFYKNLPYLGEKSFDFTIRTLPISAQLIKQIGHSPWYAGGNYLYLQTELKNTNPLFHTPAELNRKVSRLGLLVDYDNRDNVFTPDEGLQWNTLVSASDEAIGSDYDYAHASSAIFSYLPVASNFIAAFRLEYQQIWGDAPFYLLPFVNLRGIPVARYQGKVTGLAETELRWDVLPRWSLLGFAGAGKAVDSPDEFSDATWHPSVGGGFRYLIARQLKVRMGVDIARGPEQWAYYIVFGTYWMR